MTVLTRRPVPVGYHVAELRLTGTSPLLMNSGEQDRDAPLYRQFRELGEARRKSLEQEAKLREIEWRLGIYFDEQIGVYVPGKNLHELLRAAATKWKLGEDVKRSLVLVEYRVPLIYEGPRDVDGLWAEGFRYNAMAANAGIGRGRVMRCRPCFDEWAVEAEVAYDPDDLDFDKLTAVVERSQKYGLGDYRPTFGSFIAEWAFVREQRESVATSAAKRVDGRRKRANAAHVARIKRTPVAT